MSGIQSTFDTKKNKTEIVVEAYLDCHDLQIKNRLRKKLAYWYILKVRQFQNEFMKSSFLPKYKQKIVRISALCSDTVAINELLCMKNAGAQIPMDFS